MRIVFFGTPELALPTLEQVAACHDVTAVVCQPDKPQGRSAQLVPPPTKAWALAHGIEVAQPVKLNDGTFEAWLRAQSPDVCVLVAYGRILKAPILAVPRHGFLNMHPSLLPKYRGPSPIQTAVLNGDDITGITIMRLDEGMDTGDVLLQEEQPVGPEDTTESLSARLAVRGGELMAVALERLANGSAQFSPQDHTRATVTRTFEKQDGRMDWNKAATELHNLVRASVPWPVAQCAFRGQPCRVLRTAIADAVSLENSRAGDIVSIGKSEIHVATGNGVLALLRLQMAGKKPLDTGDFLRGCPVKGGERFE